MTNEHRERIIEISSTIAGLRNQLRILEGELDALLGVAPQVSVSQEQTFGVVPSYHIAGDTVADRIVQFLEQQRGHDFDANEVLRWLELPEGRIATVRSTLHRLQAENRIARPSPGRFAALPKNQAEPFQPDEPEGNSEVKHAAA